MYYRQYYQPLQHNMYMPPHPYRCGMGRCMYQQQNPYFMNNNQSMPVNQLNEPNPSSNQQISYNQPTNNPVNPSNEQTNIDEANFSHQFLNEHGQVDVNKMLSTVGHLAQTVQQVSPVIKQVNDIIQSFRV